jgi:hypothetical protein
LQYTFPSDYKFHYPELAVLFELAEEDAYKYCMRKRIADSHIGEHKTDAVARKGLLRDHWIIFGVSAGIFKLFPFFNYYFILKTFGTGMWLFSMWSLFNRGLSRTIHRNAFMTQQRNAAEVIEGEDKIMEAMRRFANDSRCLEALKGFKGDVADTMPEYRRALIQAEKNEVIAKAQRQLSAISSYEDKMGARLQESVVREVAAEFKAKFEKTPTLQSAAFDSALKSLEGSPLPPAEDPLTAEFTSAMSSIDLSGAAKANATGTVSERLAFTQQEQEKEFVNTFYVSAAEAAEVKGAAGNMDKLEKLMGQIYGKIGFHVPNTFAAEAPLESVGTGSADAYIADVNAKRKASIESTRKQQLDNFSASFA